MVVLRSAMAIVECRTVISLEFVFFFEGISFVDFVDDEMVVLVGNKVLRVLFDASDLQFEE